MKSIHYEHIPFRCIKFHEHGHLFRDNPLNATTKDGNPEANKRKDGFIQVSRRKKQGVRRSTAQENKDPTSRNQYEILQQYSKNLDALQVPPIQKTPQKIEKGKAEEARDRTLTTPPPVSNTIVMENLEIKYGDAEMDLDEK
jgi:hypothetical protein